jgi:hypothetical protein
MRSYYAGVLVVLVAVVSAGCPFKGTTKFFGDTTDYTHDTMHSITVSTSGETLMDGQPLTDELRVRMFVDSSFENLQQDTARGSGEYLVSLAELAKVPTVRRQEFFDHARQRYAATTKTGSLTPEQFRLAVLSNWRNN